MTENGRTRYRRYALVGLLILGLALLPQFIDSPYLMSILVFIGLYAIVAIGLCMLMGYAGQISLGQAAFFGMGAYASGILTATYEWDPWIALVSGAILTGILAAITGVIVLRFAGHVLAVVTLAFNMIIYILLVQMEPITGGLSPGLPGIPRLALGGFTLSNDTHYFYLIWATVLLFIFLSLNILNSRIGRALRSFHHFYGGSEEAAESVGVNPTSYKIKVFTLSAVYASVAGSIYAHYVTYLNPSPFGVFISLQFLVMVILGGLRSPWGALLGATVVVALGEALRDIVPRFVPGAFGEYQIIAYGAILIIILLLVPEGLVQVPRSLQGLWRRLTWRQVARAR
jgi:branched-chain amino acid transport system permease protein